MRNPSSFYILLLLLIFGLSINSCRKNYISDEQDMPHHTLNSQLQMDPLAQYRWASPYSMKIVRAVRNLAATITDSVVQATINAPLNNNNFQLYYKLENIDETKAAALNTWLEADSNRIVVPYPIDSMSLHPYLFTDSIMDIYETEKKVFYTTVPISQPLPAGIGAQVVDTLYVPDATELTLDFMLNLMTANVSIEFINSFQQSDQQLYTAMMNVVNNNLFIPAEAGPGGILVVSGDWNDPMNPNTGPTKIYFERCTNLFEDGPRRHGFDGREERNGRITFEETALSINEGIRGLRVTGLRYVIFPAIRYTNANGEFESEMPNWSTYVLVYRFQNSHLKIKSVDFTSVLSGYLTVLRYVLLFNIPEIHVRWVGAGNVNEVNTHFVHNHKKAHWGLTYNAVQEANDYAVGESLTSYSPTDFKFLNVMCFYNSHTASASAPMLGYISTGTGTGVTDVIFHTMGLTSLFGNTLGGLLPDLIISQNASNPRSSRRLRQTVYHEYGHALHYFKANKFSDAHWLQNIAYTIFTTEYGTGLNTPAGDFFALSEGWADFIGYNFASRKYGSGTIFSEINQWTATLVTGNYTDILERVPTFFNNFIPRGLFHDLMDGFNIDEDFDNISGYSILDIYNQLNDVTWSIQKFRENWEDEYPSVNNADLFNEYNIDLP